MPDQSAAHPEPDLFKGLPDDIKHYLAHTGAGLSIRDIARVCQCHASTVSRRIARIEQQRDDPLVDSALTQLEAGLWSNPTAAQRQIKKEFLTMTNMKSSTKDGRDNSSDKDVLRVLRRLCESGAVLAIAEDMDLAVVVREAADGSTTRTAVVSQEVAQSMALNGWIETNSSGRILRYKITNSGREKVKGSLGQTANGAMEMAEAPSVFSPAQKSWTEAEPDALEDSSRKLRYNLAESPLTVLARRRDKTGTPFLSEDLVRCGERLREDFELAQMGSQIPLDWSQYLTPGAKPPPSDQAVVGFGPEAAKARVIHALQELGPGLSDVALRCCCFLEGLESTEKRMGWSARSGKIVLRIALQRLQVHFQENLTPDAQMIG